MPELLDRLEVQGDPITIDAMGCRRDRAAKIGEVEKSGAAAPAKDRRG
jgi:predicted transposase YbfD/YdcC